MYVERCIMWCVMAVVLHDADFFLFSCTSTSSLFNHWVWNAHDLLYFTQHVFQNCNACWQCGVQAIVNLISVHVKSNIKNRWCGRQWLHSCALTHTNKSDHARWQVQPVEVNGSSLNSMAWNPLSIWNLWKLVARLHTRDSPLTLFSTSQFLLLAGLLTTGKPLHKVWLNLRRFGDEPKPAKQLAGTFSLSHVRTYHWLPLIKQASNLQPKIQTFSQRIAEPR